MRGRKRLTGQSLYYPRVMMRTLAQVLTEEYSEYGVHVANIVIDGLIDSPGTRALSRAQQQPDVVLTQDLCRVCAIPSGKVQEALDQLGLPDAQVLSLDPHTLDEVIATIRAKPWSSNTRR